MPRGAGGLTPHGAGREGWCRRHVMRGTASATWGGDGWLHVGRRWLGLAGRLRARGRGSRKRTSQQETTARHHKARPHRHWRVNTG